MDSPGARSVMQVPLAPHGARGRTLDDVLTANLPRLFRAGSWLGLALPRSWSVRRLLLSYFTVRTMYCFGRGDVDVLLSRCSPSCQVTIVTAPPELELDNDHYYGHAGVRRLLENLNAQWPGAEWMPRERYELADGRFLHLSTVRVADGHEVEFAQLLCFRRGAMVREQLWIGAFERAKEAAGVISGAP
jgi:hypothetical protein